MNFKISWLSQLVLVNICKQPIKFSGVDILVANHNPKGLNQIDYEFIGSKIWNITNVKFEK